MKLNAEKVDSLDVEKEELRDLHENSENFWKSVQDIARYGIPSCDSKGHFSEVRIRCRPNQTDIIAGIKERIPENWFKSQGALYRSILAVGCKAYFRVLDMEESEWNEVLMGLNMIAKRQRCLELRQEVATLKSSIVNGTMDSHEKSKVISMIDRLESKIMEM